MTDKAAREAFEKWVSTAGVIKDWTIERFMWCVAWQAAHDAAMTAQPDLDNLTHFDQVKDAFATMKLKLQAAQQREAELRAALADARSGFGMAYNAIQNDCTDEALLHCGAHEARAHKVLATQPTNKGETT